MYDAESKICTIENELPTTPRRSLLISSKILRAAKPNYTDSRYNGKPTTLGVGKLLKVTAGDRVMANVEAWYKSDLTHEQPGDLSSHFNAILSAVQTGATQLGEATRLIGNTSMLPAAIENFITNQQNFDNERGAYLNWIFLSEETLTDEFMVTGYDDFFKGQRSPRDCDVAGAATLSMGEEGITIPQNGYLYVFVSNSNTTYPVLFDNFRVSVQHSALLEETHYYPFGLAMAGISHKASGGSVNNYKFNGKEEQKDEFGIGSGLDIYDFGARQYDAQIGRWHSVDPLAETMRRWSPYCFSFNNPLRFIDPDGMSPTDPNDDGMVNYMDVKDKDGKVTRVWDYADNKDENGNEPNTQESTGLEVGDRALMQLAGEGEGDKKCTETKKNVGAGDKSKNKSTTNSSLYRTPNGEKTHTVKQWAKEYEGKTWNDIVNQRQRQYFFYKHISAKGGPNLDWRYVQLDDGKILDMRHVLIVGMELGEAAGIGIELGQFFTDKKSFNQAQDYFSNEVGSSFLKYLQSESLYFNPSSSTKEFGFSHETKLSNKFLDFINKRK